jgi:AraC-like DNA-binding protein
MPSAVTEHDSPRNRRGSFAASYLGVLADWLRTHGHVDSALFREVAAIADDRNARVPRGVYDSLLDRAAQETGDAELGLHVGESIRPGHYGVAGYVAMNCATLGDALKQHLRYQALVADTSRPIVDAGPDEVLLSWDASQGSPHRQAAEANLSGWINFVRWASARPVTPKRVEFRHAAPADIREHQRIFGCPIVFGRPRHAIAFAPALLDQPLARPDDEVRQLMELHAQKLLQGLADNDDPVSRARAYVAGRLSAGEITLTDVAAHVALTERALQRKLQAAGLNFRALLEEVRREQAKQLLKNPSFSVGDAAFLLGFSEQSAFQRAFRRWTQLSPGEYRRRTLEGEKA